MNKKIFSRIVILLLFIFSSGFPSFSQSASEKESSPETQQGPLLAGVGGVTYPERLPESYVKPVYPKRALEKEIGCVLCLRIVVKKDGTVGDIEVLHSSESKLGFEKAAKKAVKKWRYKPALKNGKPVDFDLHLKVNFDMKGIEIDEIEPQHQQEPFIPGFDGVIYPDRIPESYVRPVYCPLARREKAKGMVVLQIVVTKDGTVGNINVLSSPDPKYGFVDAAINAVKQWRYKPALKDCEPVDVYMTVHVHFEILRRTRKME